jgi:hypothetical protein
MNPRGVETNFSGTKSGDSITFFVAMKLIPFVLRGVGIVCLLVLRLRGRFRSSPLKLSFEKTNVSLDIMTRGLMEMCDSCSSGDAKYCCPGCGRRTCSLACVRAHKIKYECSGLKGVPTSPVAADTGVKYSEDLFFKDYNFLESVCSYTSNLSSKTPSLDSPVENDALSRCEDSVVEPRQRVFKRIQRIGKLAELVALPATFSRSKQNRTRLVSSGANKESVSEESELVPEEKSARRARISWTIDLLDFKSRRVLETLSSVTDDAILSDLVSKWCPKRVCILNETRTRGIAKWREIEKKDWSRSLSFILIGARCIEYPRILLEIEDSADEDCCEATEGSIEIKNMNDNE